MRSPTGRTCATPADATLTVDGLEITARFPRLLVWVKGGSDNRHEWRRLMRRLALAYESTDEHGQPIPADDYGSGYQTAYVVYGLPASLRTLLDGDWPFLACKPCYVMSAKPHMRSSGAGEEKYRPRGTGGEVDVAPFPWPDGPISLKKG